MRNMYERSQTKKIASYIDIMTKLDKVLRFFVSDDVSTSMRVKVTLVIRKYFI